MQHNRNVEIAMNVVNRDIVSSVTLSGAKRIGLHNRIKTNKNHYSLALEEFQDQDFENILKRPPFCGILGHEKKEMEFFCKVCKVAICNACALLDHKGHAKMLLELAANERKLSLESAIESKKKIAQSRRGKSRNLTNITMKF